ncbi:MAG: putative Ig domain-containing protein [Bacteroidota bacterium]|nr:putative Ig domain-containing protein [Bacteroidota bacterium]
MKIEITIKYFVLIIIIMFTAGMGFSQTGPGGVGNEDGTSGQPNNELWFDAGIIGQSNGTSVNVFKDRSGNANDAVQATSGYQPIYYTPLNPSYDFPVVYFDGTDDFMPFDGSVLAGKDYTVIYVGQRNSDGLGSVGLGGSNTGTNNNLHLYWTSSQFRAHHYGNDLQTDMVLNTETYSGGTDQGEFGIFITRLGSTEGNPQRKNYQNNYYLGGRDDNRQLNSWNGAAMSRVIFGTTEYYSETEIAEVIIFSTAINNAQLQIINNYLSEKYAIAIDNDKYTAATGYTYDVSGIGNEGGESHIRASSAGVYLSDDGGTVDVGEYVFYSNDNTTNDIASIQTGTNVTNCGAKAAWNRNWYLQKYNVTSVDVKLTFDLPEALTGGKYPQNPANYVLLYKANTGDDYSKVTVSASGLADADQIYFDVSNANLSDGYYTFGTNDQINSPVEGVAENSWYALTSGDWDNWETWTLDPSGNLPDNPNHETPSSAGNSSDRVFINSGKTVTIQPGNDNKTNSQITVDGRLDIKTTSGHNFTEIRGAGIILCAADNFPAGVTTHFSSLGQGEGTVVYYGNGYTLATDRTFFDVELTQSTTGDILVQASDYTINGSLTIETGIWQINDATNDVVRNLTVKKDVLVQAGGQITVGTGNSFAAGGYDIGTNVMPEDDGKDYHSIYHQFEVWGNLTNKGSVILTNQAAPDYNDFTETGGVTLKFKGLADNVMSCEGPTDLYNLIVDKGTDKTYVLTVSSTNTANFRLFGANSCGRTTAGGYTSEDPQVRKALWVYHGTLKLIGSIDIPTLSEGNDEGGNGDYAVGRNACFWVADEQVTVYTTASATGQVPAGADGVNTGSSNQAMSVYGKFRISDGFFGTRNSAGFIFWAAADGQVYIEGGETDVAQMRSAGGGAGIASYVQSGGLIRARGNETEPGEYTGAYPLFGLEGTDAAFIMSGGEILLRDEDGDADPEFSIQTAEGNYLVTGGKLTIDVRDTRSFQILSTANLWDLEIKNNDLSGNMIVELENDLKVSHDLIINNYCELNVEDPTAAGTYYDLSIGGDFNIIEGATYDCSNWDGNPNNEPTSGNTTIFNGAEDAVLYVGHNTDDGYEQFLYNFTVNKTQGKKITVTGDPNKDPDVVSSEWHNRLVHVSNNCVIESGILNQGRQSVRLFQGVNVKINGQLGTYEHLTTHLTSYIMFRDGDLTIDSENGALFGNIKFNSTGTVTFTSDVYIKRIGLYKGLYNIATYNLKVDYLHQNATANNYTIGAGSTSEMIYSAGNASDGGLSILITGDATHAFPIGVSGKYTPAKVDVSNYSDDGYITINPVDHYLWTLTGGSTNVLDYYWSIKHVDFITNPNVYLTFNYLDSDADGNDNSYRAARVINYNVIEELGNWSVDAGNDEFYYADDATQNPIILKKGDYTTGNPSVFNSDVRTLYARKDGEWHDYDTWSTTPDGNTPLTHSKDLPTTGDIVVIGENSTSGNEDRNYAVAVSSTHADYAPINIAMLSILRYGGGESSLVTVGQNGADCNFGFVTNRDPDAADPESTADHSSKIIISGSDIPAGDFGEFLNASSTIWTYSRAFPGSNADIDDADGLYLSTTYYPSYTVGNTIAEYPILQFEYSGYNSGYIELSDVDITVHNDIRFFKDDQYLKLNSAANGDVTVENDIEFNGGNSFNIEFQGSGTARKLTVYGNIDFKNQANSEYTVEDITGTLKHKLVLYGDVINPSGSSNFVFFRASNKAMADIEFAGLQNSTFANMTAVPLFNQLIMNKGTDPTYSMAMNSNLSLNSDPSGTSNLKPIQMLNGKLILNNSGISLNLSTGGDDFLLPAESTLELLDGVLNISGDDTGIKLNGKLIVSGGTVDMATGTGNGNNYIEYGAGGLAAIEVSGGTLKVGSQIRRQLRTEEGILLFSQSGGIVEIGQYAAPVNDRGVFEILNAGSSFTHTNGSFTIVRAQTSPAIAAFYFDPEVSDLKSGTTINIGNLNTPSSQDIGMYINKPLMNLTVSGANNPRVSLWTVPATIEENLTISANTILDADGNTMTLTKGNFINNGSFIHNNNIVLFAGLSDQEIQGSSLTAFYQLTKQGTNKLTLQSNITIEDDLRIENGNFLDNSNEVSLYGDLYNTGLHSYGGSGRGIVFEGSIVQFIMGETNIESEFGKLTVNNINGITVNSGIDIKINNAVQLESGVFDIGQNLLTLSLPASFIEQNPYSAGNMISTNKSFTDSGIKKYFPSGAGSFLYPIGAGGIYTPVKTLITQNSSSTAYLIVKAADEIHPTITEDVEAPDDEITDVDNALQYYWSLNTDGFTDLKGTVEFYYEATDVVFDPTTPSGYSVTDYIPARLLSDGSGNWNKYDWDDFDETNEKIIFSFLGDADAEISGDYTAGIQPQNYGNGAIPDQVPGYISVQNGNWTNSATWDTYPTSGGTVPSSGPSGAIVIIDNAHTVLIDQNYIKSYSTEIKGVLEQGTKFGNRLGIVNGSGTLSTETGLLPAGYYEEFLSEIGGTLEYTGTTDVDVLNDISQLRHLKLTGTGERRFPNLDFTVLGNLTIDGVNNTLNFINEHNKMMTVNGDILFNSGSFNAGSGVDAIVRIGGTTAQTVSGTENFTGTNAFYNFEMSNNAGLTLASPVDVDNQLKFINGIISTTSSNILTLENSLQNIVSGAGPGNFVDGPLSNRMIQGGDFDFPVGDNSRYGNIFLENIQATGYWVTQYYNDNPLNATDPESMDPANMDGILQHVSENEYWRVLAPSSTTALVKLRWDALNGGFASDANRSEMRIAEWNQPTTSVWNELDATPTISGDANAGTIASDETTTFNEFGTGNFFTISSTYISGILTWDGSVDNVWNDANNWTNGGVPTSLDEIDIPDVANDPVVSISAECGKISLQTGATLSVNAGNSLTVSGDFTMNGTLILKSPANSNASASFIDNGNITGTGEIQVERYLTAYEAHYVSSPIDADVTNNANSDLFTTHSSGEFNPNFHKYYEPEDLNGDPNSAPAGNFDSNNLVPGWQYAHNGEGAAAVDLTEGKGYSSWSSGGRTIIYTGTPNTGSFNFSSLMSYTANDQISSSLPEFYDGWNLIGNPYPSAIDWNLVAGTASNIDNGVYTWDGTQYASYVNGNPSGGQTNKIAPMQGFFVHATGENPSVTVNNSHRVHSNEPFFKSTKEEQKRLSFRIAGNGYEDNTVIYTQYAATKDFDGSYDAYKLFSPSWMPNIPHIYTLTDEGQVPVSINAIDINAEEDLEIPLCIAATSEGTYTILLEEFAQFDNLNLYFEDVQEGIFVPLSDMPETVVNYSGEPIEDRFIIHTRVNNAPEVVQTIKPKTLSEDELFSFTVESTVFNEPDQGDEIVAYTSSLSGGEQLPAWLEFDNQNLTYSGKPGNEDVEVYQFVISAFDTHGAQADAEFTVEVLNVNDAPYVSNPIKDFEINENEAFEYIFNENVFEDIDFNDELSYTSKFEYSDETTVDWLFFEPEARRFHGIPSNGNAGLVNVALRATDLAGEYIETYFGIDVMPATGTNEISPEANSIELFPNPCITGFYVKSDELINAELFLIDLSGRQLKHITVNKDNQFIPVNGLSTGTYLVRIISEKGIVHKKVFVE